MRIGFSPRVDSVSGALAEVPNLAKAMSEDLEQYVDRFGLPWRPDVRIVPTSRRRILVLDRRHPNLPPLARVRALRGGRIAIRRLSNDPHTGFAVARFAVTHQH